MFLVSDSRSVYSITPVQPRVIFDICSVCQDYTEIYHRVTLPKSGKLLVQYCIYCFD